MKLWCLGLGAVVKNIVSIKMPCTDNRRDFNPSGAVLSSGFGQSGGCDMSFLWDQRFYNGVTDFLVGAIIDPLVENDNRPGSGGDF